MDDLLWPHFRPLWRDLVAACSTNILVAGGYGLFLKQRWLSNTVGLPTVVPIQTGWMQHHALRKTSTLFSASI